MSKPTFAQSVVAILNGIDDADLTHAEKQIKALKSTASRQRVLSILNGIDDADLTHAEKQIKKLAFEKFVLNENLKKFVLNEDCQE